MLIGLVGQCPRRQVASKIADSPAHSESMWVTVPAACYRSWVFDLGRSGPWPLLRQSRPAEPLSWRQPAGLGHGSHERNQLVPHGLPDRVFGWPSKVMLLITVRLRRRHSECRIVSETSLWSRPWRRKEWVDVFWSYVLHVAGLCRSPTHASWRDLTDCCPVRATSSCHLCRSRLVGGAEEEVAPKVALPIVEEALDRWMARIRQTALVTFKDAAD